MTIRSIKRNRFRSQSNKEDDECAAQAVLHREGRLYERDYRAQTQKSGLGGEKQLLPLIVADGDIPAESLVKGLEAQEEDLPEVLGPGAYAYFLKGLSERFVQNHDVPALTARLSKQEYLIVHEEYTDPFGIGPIANYVVRKELERSPHAAHPVRRKALRKTASASELLRTGER